MYQGLNDAKKDIERRGRHAGIGEPPCPWIGVGPASEREREKHGAWSDTTPTIFVRGDQMLRAAAHPLMPEPWPMGT